PVQFRSSRLLQRPRLAFQTLLLLVKLLEDLPILQQAAHRRDLLIRLRDPLLESLLHAAQGLERLLLACRSLSQRLRLRSSLRAARGGGGLLLPLRLSRLAQALRARPHRPFRLLQALGD